MRTRGALSLLVSLPALLFAQPHHYSEPLLLTTPGIATQLEKFEPLSISGNPRLGDMPIVRLTMDH